MIEGQTYTLDEIEEKTGFDRRTVAYYVQQGLLPKVGRRGPRTRYSQLFLNRLSFIRMIRDLQDQGAMGTMTLSDFRDLFRRVPDETIADVVSGRESLAVIELQAPPDVPEMASPLARSLQMAQKIGGLRRRVKDGSTAESVMSAGMAMDPAREPPPEAEPDEAFLKRAYRPLRGDGPAAADDDTASAESRGLNVDGGEDFLSEGAAKLLDSPPPPDDEELKEALARLHAVVKRQPRAYLRTTETWTRARITEELGISARGIEDRHLPLLERVARILRRLMQEDLGGY